jgi:4-hydroxy-tetrahydrodipicolinate synthase
MEFKGTYTAMVTPFRDGQVDYDAYRRLLIRQKEAGVTGVVPCGCTGEAATLSDKERRMLLDVTLEAVGDSLQVIAGTGTNATESTIARTKEAQEAGAHAAMLISPYYNKPSQAGLSNHYRRVGEATTIPLILYNVPGRTGVTIAPETMAVLFETGRYPAVKEAAGSIEAVSSIGAASDITILSGDDSLTVPMMSIGARGVVSVVSNVLPLAVRQMVDHAIAGDYVQASRAHFDLLPVMRAAFIESNPSPVKAMLAAENAIANELRPPLAPVTSPSMKTILDVIGRYRQTGSVTR